MSAVEMLSMPLRVPVRIMESAGEIDQTQDLDRIQFEQFLATYGSHAILTRGQERDLGRRVQAGLRVREALANPDDATPEQEAILRGGDQARDLFLRSNIKLAIGPVRSKYRTNPIGEKLGRMTLLQAALIGINHAITKFDPERGLKFSTYALPWVLQGLDRVIEKEAYDIKIPASKMAQIKKLWNLRGQSDEEIMHAMGIDEEGLARLREIDHLNHMISFDAPAGDSGDLTYGDVIPIEKDMAEEVVEVTERERLRRLVECLEPSLLQVIELRFGLYDGVKWTYQAIGEVTGKSTTTVRKLEDKALAQLLEPAQEMGFSPLEQSA